MDTNTALWIGFTIFIVTMMVLDLGVFHRRAHEISFREAAVWTGIWVALALAFNGVVYFYSPRGQTAALEFFTGYLIEWSLSMDNVFVFVVLLRYFGVPKRDQHRVLFWGILGAVILRLSFILIGTVLLQKFQWAIYVFGAIVLIAGIKMFSHAPEEIHPERNPILILARKCLRTTPTFMGQRFFVRQGGVLFATPLFLVLVVVNVADVMFAFDSIPAIFAITRDTFIVFTSNVFAILGLRSLYFMLAAVTDMFRYLNKGLAIILCFIGIKMLIADFYHIPVGVSLGIVCLVLGFTIAISIYIAKNERKTDRRTR